MAKKAPPKSNPKDYRPNPSEDKNGPHTKPIFDPRDYRSPFESAGGKAGGKGGGKGGGKKKAKIFHYSHRLAPGASKDPWGGAGRG